MSVRRLRTRLLGRATAAAVALLVFAGTFDWGHPGGDDPDEAIVLVHHDHDAHRFASPTTSDRRSADHCYICHSLRGLHNGLTTASSGVLADGRSARYSDIYHVTVPYAAGVSLSSRAPPSASL